MSSDLGDELLRRGLTYTRLSSTEAQAVDRRWLSSFAVGVRAAHGHAIHGGYRWHGFSFGLQPCLAGEVALAAYLGQWRTPFLLFDEGLAFCALCPAQDYPDLSELRRDLYVAHHHLKWTAAFTHEQPQVGPFFAESRTPNPALQRTPPGGTSWE